MRLLPGSKDQFKWVWNDLISPRKRAFGFIVVLDLISILFQIAAYAVLFKYVNALEQGTDFDFMGYHLSPRSSQSVLTFIALSTGLLFLLSGLIEYWSKLKTIRLARNYEAFCSQRILDSVKISSNLNSVKPKYDERRLRKALIKDVRFCGRLAKIFSFSLLTTLKFVGSLVFMFYVNITLTLVILILVVPIVLLMKNMARTVVKLTEKRETKLPIFIFQKKQLLKDSLEKSDTELDRSEIQEDINMFYRLYHSINEKLVLNDLIVAVFIAIFTLVIVLIAGNLVLFNGMPWAVFIAYILALRYFFGSLRSLGNMFKRLSKIYDYVNHYINTLHQIESGLGVPILAAYEAARKNAIDKSEGLGLDLDNESDDDDDDDDDL